MVAIVEDHTDAFETLLRLGAWLNASAQVRGAPPMQSARCASMRGRAGAPTAVSVYVAGVWVI